MALCWTILLVSAASAAYQHQPDHSLEYLLSLTGSPGGRPSGVDPEFDCAWRKMALPYALQIQPSLSNRQQKAIHDALQLTSLCNTPFTRTSTVKWDAASLMGGTQGTQGRSQIFVDPINGTDTGAGTIADPLKSLIAAVNTSRVSSRGSGAVIQLRAGIYYLPETVVLGPQDSGLTITAYQNEVAELSGGVLLSGLQWKAQSATNGARIYSARVDAHLVPAGLSALQINGNRATLARYPNANPELDLFPKGYVGAKTSWLKPQYKGKGCDSAHQCGQSVNYTIKTPATEWHGMYQVSSLLHCI